MERILAVRRGLTAATFQRRAFRQVASTTSRPANQRLEPAVLPAIHVDQQLDHVDRWQQFIQHLSVMATKPRGFGPFMKDGAKASGGGTGNGDKSNPEGKGEGGNKNAGGQQQQQPNQVALAGLTTAILAYYLLSAFSRNDNLTFQQMYSEFLSRGLVERIQVVNKNVARIHIRGDAPPEHANKMYTMQIGDVAHFEQRLEQCQQELGLHPQVFVPVQFVTETDVNEEMWRLLPTLLFLLPMLAMMRGFAQSGAGAGAAGGMNNVFKIGKAFPAGSKDLKSKTKFTDVAGLHQAKKEVVEFVDFLKDPKRYEKVGAKIPKGGLLVGPPGTGKTLLARAVAGEADRPFFSMSGSDFIEMFVGVGPSRVRDLFKQARDSAPSIIFIDEIDAVGRKRGKGGFAGGNDERENTLNQMLVEMDGFATSTGVVVLAGTNRADILDPALTRPGRFDRQIHIGKPDLPERQEIFHVHLRPLKFSANEDKDNIARRMAALTPGFSGADIANVCNEAAIYAARRKAEMVTMQDFELAGERVIGGLPKTSGVMSPAQKRTTALHESGHAVAGWFLKHADPLLKVSIVPRDNGALGFAQYLPEENATHTKDMLLDKICTLLAGRAAEELFVGEISSGASDDLNKVTRIAYGMVSVFGMDDSVGLLSYQQEQETSFQKPYSEETAQTIDRKAREIVDAEYARVKQLLKEKEPQLLLLADRLFEKETLVYKELTDILGERKVSNAELLKYVAAGEGMGEVPPEEVLTEQSGVVEPSPQI